MCRLSRSAGANASAEEASEALEDGAQTVINAVSHAAMYVKPVASAHLRCYTGPLFPSAIHPIRQEELPYLPQGESRKQMHRAQRLMHYALQGYMKNVKKYLEANKPDRVEAFEKGAQAFAKKGEPHRGSCLAVASGMLTSYNAVVGNFKDYEFYIGESMDPDGMVLLLNYREDGTTPYLTLWKDGLKEVKL